MPVYEQTLESPITEDTFEHRFATDTAHFSRNRLRRMHAALERHVGPGRMPGLVALVRQRGREHVDTIGALAFDSNLPMRRDTIFRIASMTKPITAAAAMILVEECRLRLDDPVDHWLPELANRKVLKQLEGPLDDTVPAERPISLRDLLTFRAGFGAIMVFPSRHPIQKAMDEAGLSPTPNRVKLTPDEFMKRLGALPLV